MKKLLLSTLALLSFSHAALADSQSCCRAGGTPNWYAGLSGSLVFLKPVDVDWEWPPYISGLLDHQGFDLGYGLGGQLGYRIYPNIRAELEITYRSSDLSSNNHVTYSAPAGFYSAQRSTAYMVNAYYDWHNSTKITPYIGAGIGEVYVQNPFVDFDAWTLGHQYMAGISYDMLVGVTPVEFNLGYRYFSSNCKKVTIGGIPGTFDFNNQSHNIELGGKLFF